MTVAVIALVFALVGSLSLNGWLTYRYVRKAEESADRAVLRGEAETEQTLTVADLDMERDRRKQAEATLQLMKDEVRHAATRAPIGAGLDLDDVATRIDRLWAAYYPDGAPAADDHGRPPDEVPDPPGAVAGG